MAKVTQPEGSSRKTRTWVPGCRALLSITPQPCPPALKSSSECFTESLITSPSKPHGVTLIKPRDKPRHVRLRGLAISSRLSRAWKTRKSGEMVRSGDTGKTMEAALFGALCFLLWNTTDKQGWNPKSGIELTVRFQCQLLRVFCLRSIMKELPSAGSLLKCSQRLQLSSEAAA